MKISPTQFALIVPVDDQGTADNGRCTDLRIEASCSNGYYPHDPRATDVKWRAWITNPDVAADTPGQALAQLVTSLEQLVTQLKKVRLE